VLAENSTIATNTEIFKMKNRSRIYTTLTICLLVFIGINASNADVPENMVLIPAGDGIASFYMDKFEVTNAQYKEFIDANPLWQKDKALTSIVGDTYLWGWKGNMYPKGRANHPVVDISWFAAKAYAEWVGKELPTQAQWEKAARGVLSGKKYPWGDANPRNKANYNRYTPKVSFSKPPTKEVGSYPPNEYGLYDMVGNVSEWCLDRLDVDDIHGRYHRMRGGSWFNTAEELKISKKSQHPADDGMGTVGFRCVSVINGVKSTNVGTDMSSWLYENMQNGFDSALYSVSEGFTPESGLEARFDKIVKYFTGHPRSFQKELIRVFHEAIAEHTPDFESEEIGINRDMTLQLWKFYLEIHFEHSEKSVEKKLSLLKGCILDKIDSLFMEEGS
jgi:hypothetical protein